ncbi:MAG: type IV pilus biogenesis/stability protein PilW [Gammaproteobacteria bacterium]
MKAWWLSGLLVLSLAACTQQPLRTGSGQGDSLAQIYTNLGLTYLQQGKRELALEKLQRAIEADPDLPAANHYLAETYQQLGQVEEAERYYRRAVKLDPGNPMLRNNFGAFLCGHGSRDEAEQQFLLAAKNPRYETPEQAYENAGMCAQRIPDAEKAEQNFRAALGINSKLPRTLHQMASLSYEKQRYLPARAYLQRYLEVAQHTSQSLWLGIKIERALGDDNAVAKYEAQLKSNFPDSEETRLLEAEKK